MNYLFGSNFVHLRSRNLYNIGLKIGVAAFLLLTVLAAPGSARSAPLPAGVQPYPDSTIIERINWDFSSLLSLAPGSDLWPTTWGPDGGIYTSWGDGGGFGGTNSDGRVSLGFAKMTGDPQNFTTTNIWGGKNGQNPAQFNGKTAGIISVDGTLYAWINTQNRSFGPDYRLAWSTDRGARWQQSSWTMNSGSFALAAFLNFGMDNAGARDGYVYSYGGQWGTNPDVFLARVPKHSVTNINAYEYLVGFDNSGNPVWSSNASARVAVFTDAQAGGFNTSLLPSAVFNAKLRRYLLTVPHGDAGQWGVFDAPEPWGPWTTVDYYDNWGGYSSFSSEALIYAFSTKWMSPDGLDMWMTYSGVGGNLDAFKLIKGTAVLVGGPISNENELPVGVISTSVASGETPLLVDFDGTGSYDADGSIVRHEWDFDYDGSTFDIDHTGATFQRTYNRDGSYIAALRVTDDQQAASITTVDITAYTTLGGDGKVPPPVVDGLVYEFMESQALNGVDEYIDTLCCDDMPEWTVSARVSSPNAPGSDRVTGPVFGERNCCTITWDHFSAQFRGALALKVKGKWHSASFGNLEAGREYHLAGTYDGETLRAYRDGVLVDENGSMSGAPDSEPANVMLGKHPYGENYFEGTVRDVMIFDRALNETEIAALN